MKTNKEKFLTLVTETDEKFIEEVKKREKERARLKASFMIGIKVLARLDELGWTQKQLAEAMEVAPQQVNKIVRGKQNLTLDTLVRLQEVLQIPLLASWYEKKSAQPKPVEMIKAKIFEQTLIYFKQPQFIDTGCRKIIGKIERKSFEYS
jgi:transcriptional regulator with XRE-family HTH domain